MTAGIGYALVAMVFYGLADLVYKRAAIAGVPSHHFLMVQAWCYAPAMFLYGTLNGTLVPGTAMLWGMSAGVFIWIALYNFSRSLALGAVSVNAPIFRLSFVLTAALAVWLLNEPLTLWKLAGLASALVAVWLLLATQGSGKIRAAALVHVLIATLAMAAVNLIYKLGALAGGSPATVLAGQAGVFLPLATGVSWWTSGRLRPEAKTWRHAPVAALLLLFATVPMLAGLAYGQASVLVPIAQMSFVVTALLGLVFLREPFTARKAIGLASAVAALGLLAHA